MLLPGVRWFFRRRLNRLIDELNKRLDLRLPPIALTKRRVLIDRLMYDSKVMHEVSRFCEEHDASFEIAMNRVGQYAEEIVPAFNAYFYFRIGSWFSKTTSEMLYDVRILYADREHLNQIEKNKSIVLVINHRSNMDYILLAYLVLRSAALSYAVGEWARVWPLQQAIRMLGGYFVRRGSRNALYRRVLECYVQMAVEGGASQAIFLEGSLSRDGKFREPKIGLLDYMMRDFDVDADRDILFIPIGINYDRVLEDRTLLLDAGPNAVKRSGLTAVMKSFAFLFKNIWLRIRGRWRNHGFAAACFGTPVSLREYCQKHGFDPRKATREKRVDQVQMLAKDLMQDISRLVPACPVSMLAQLFISEPDREFSTKVLGEQFSLLGNYLREQGCPVISSAETDETAMQRGVEHLLQRRLIAFTGDRYQMVAEERSMLNYYANAISHWLEPIESDKKST